MKIKVYLSFFLYLVILNLLLEANQSPVANAGTDRIVNLGATVFLNGTASDDPDGDELDYNWTQLEGSSVQLSLVEPALPRFVAPNQVSTLKFRLQVNDGRLTSTDEVTIEVKEPNRAPIANAGPDQSVDVGAVVFLNGNGSSDADGDKLNYFWKQLSGTSVFLANAQQSQISFLALSIGVYEFELSVSDQQYSQTDKIKVVVSQANRAPFARIGEDQSVELGETVTLDGSLSTDLDGDSLTYQWLQLSGPSVVINHAQSSKANIIPSIEGSYQFELKVSDGKLQSTDKTAISIVPKNRAPVANAGSDLIKNVGETVFLNGASSNDPDGDPLSYRWIQLEGSSVQLSMHELPLPSFIAPVQATVLKFRLEVSDGKLTSVDEVSVRVNIPNRAPYADAGLNQSVNVMSLVTLNGNHSHDPDGDNLNYTWRQLSGPPISLNNARQSQANFAATFVGTYEFELKVSDQEKDHVDRVTITVIQPNRAPLAHAGDDQNIEIGETIRLTAIGSSDPDGDKLSFQWKLLSGPNIFILNSQSIEASVSPILEGTYQFEVSVSDSTFSSSDTVTLFVTRPNRSPIADAGSDQMINANKNVILNGNNSSDPDGDSLSYSWTQIEGAKVYLSSTKSSSLSFTAPSESTILKFKLQVSDGELSSTDEVIVVVTLANRSPIANAGSDQSVDSNHMVHLQGHASSDPDDDSLSYSWRQVSGPPIALLKAQEMQANFLALIVGSYEFELKVSDGTSQSTDRVMITVTAANQKPIAKAGIDQNVNTGSVVFLNATQSSDPDGDTLNYKWVQLEGPNVALSLVEPALPSFTAPSQTSILKFRLEVSDGKLVSTDEVLVVVRVPNRAPIANAGLDQTVNVNSLVILLGDKSADPDGDLISYQWSQVSGPSVTLSNANRSGASFTATLVGSYVFQLEVFDSQEKSLDQVMVTVIQPNRAPIARAGMDQTHDFGVAKVSLDGSGSSDPDGDVLSYQWKQLSGPSLQLTGLEKPQMEFTPTEVGTYTFQLSVHDEIYTSTDDVIISIQTVNRAPVAKAGSDQNVTTGSVVFLNAIQSSDPDGDPLNYKWVQMEGIGVLLSLAEPGLPSFTAPSQTSTLKFRLEVSDGNLVSVDEVLIVVKAPNRAPVANAGLDQTVSVNSLVTLLGHKSTDPDGDLISYQWSQVSGPPVTLSNANRSGASFTATLLGNYVFQLEVSDSQKKSLDQVKVTVIQSNRAPIARAGMDQTHGFGIAKVSLDGSGSSDPDGDVLSYQWKQLSGPSLQLAGLETPQVEFAPTEIGTYMFQLSVFDKTYTSTDYVIVFIKAVNRAPVAKAGLDQNVNTGSVVFLNATKSSDPDGDVLNFKWVQLEGESVSLLLAEPSLPSFIAPSQTATLKFRLEVNDGELNSTDEVIINIKATNRSPIAHAGEYQRIEVNHLVSLDGSQSSDLDGDHLSYEWKQTSGPQVTLDQRLQVKSSFLATVVGNYGFELKVSDGQLSSTDRVELLVYQPNRSPIARAGDDQNREANTTILLNGGGSSDPDGDVLSYQWTQISGSTVILNDKQNVEAIFTPNELGVYKFELKVSDGITYSIDGITIVIIAANQIPIADAGLDQTFDINSWVTLDGGKSSDPDGDSLSYQWIQVSGPSISLNHAEKIRSNFLATTLGSYKFKLEVSDGKEKSSDTVNIKIVQPNRAPIARAGDDQEYVLGDRILLDANESSDPDGDSLSYQWVQQSGPSVLLSNETLSKTTVLVTDAGSYQFELRVSDGTLRSTDHIVLKVIPGNRAPIANAGADQRSKVGEVVFLNAIQSRDPDGDTINYRWSQLEGPKVDLNVDEPALPNFVAPEEATTLSFRLNVSDSRLSSNDEVVIVIEALNIAPIANAGQDQNVYTDDLVLLDGRGSHDPDGDSLVFLWSQNLGSPVELKNANRAQASFMTSKIGSYEFELKVSDGDVERKDIVKVTVVQANRPPVARAGDDRDYELGPTVSLDGSGSHDPDGDQLNFQWSQVSGPSVLLSNSKNSKSSFLPKELGEYEFELKVSDEKFSVFDKVVIVITNANRKPIARAGADLSVNISEKVTLDASLSSDPDGDELVYHWEQVGGPSVNLNDEKTSSPSFVAPDTVATLIFQLKVNDGKLNSTDEVSIVVEAPNQSPIAKAGADQKININEEVTLNGDQSSDPDDDTLNYRWSQISGPTIALEDREKVQVHFTPIVPGNYLFELEVSDGEYKHVDRVLVLAQQNNQKPHAIAGKDREYRMGEIIQLDGSGSYDQDKDTLEFQWDQRSGPSVSLLNHKEATASFEATKMGSYQFELTVSDRIEYSTDVVTIIITTANRAPIANAGEVQSVLVGSSVRLDGSLSNDPDEDEVSYFWKQISGTLVSLNTVNSVSPEFTATKIEEDLVFVLEVDDGKLKSRDQTIVEVREVNQKPIAHAGDRKKVYFGTEVTLDGSASTDPNNDILQYEWKQISGPVVELSQYDSMNIHFKAPVQTTQLRFMLRVFDGKLYSEPDYIDVEVLDDQRAPKLKIAIHPSPNQYGWSKEALNIKLSAKDDLSGIDFINDSTLSLKEEGLGQPVFIEAMDKAGNRETLSFLVSIDQTAPNLSLKYENLSGEEILQNANGWFREKLKVVFDASDQLSGIQKVSEAFEIKNEGAKQLVVGSSRDYADNESFVKTEISLDLTPPLVEITSIVDGQHLAFTPIFEGKLYDALSGIDEGKVSFLIDGSTLDGKVQFSEGSFSMYPNIELEEGEHLLMVVAHDRAGQIGIAEVSFKIDFQLVPLSIVAPKINESFNHQRPPFSWNLSSKGGILDYRTTIKDQRVLIDGQLVTEQKGLSLTRQNQSFSWTPEKELEEGQHELTIEIVNHHGDFIQRTVPFYIDITKTTVLFNRSNGLILSDARPKFGGMLIETGSGIDEENSFFYIDGSTVAGLVLESTSFSWQAIDNIPNGDHEAKIVIRDHAGNESIETLNFTINVEHNTPPVLKILSPQANHSFTSESVGFYGSVGFRKATELDKIWFYINETTQKSEFVFDKNEFFFNPSKALKEGSYTFRVRAKDLFGNVASEAMKFIVGTTSSASLISNKYAVRRNVAKASIVSETVTLQNTGKHLLQFTTFVRDDWLNVEPKSAQLAPGKKMDINVSMNSVGVLTKNEIVRLLGRIAFVYDTEQTPIFIGIEMNVDPHLDQIQDIAEEHSGSSNVGNQSPTAASLGKYGEVPQGSYTGQVGVQVPLHSIKGRSLSVPIGLSYQSSGVRVEEIPSWVGTGWDLFAGGVITRTVRGIPDDRATGYLNTGHRLNDEDTWELPKDEDLNNLNAGTWDSEPDMWYFNFGGGAGQMVMGYPIDGEPGKMEIRTVPHQKIDIQFHKNGSHIDSWTIRANDGTIYIFGEKEQTIDEFNGAPFSGEVYVSSWFLSEIRSADGNDVITFNYIDYESTFERGPYQEKFDLKVGGILSSVGGAIWRKPLIAILKDSYGKRTPYTIRGKRLRSIASDLYQAVFDATKRDDGEHQLNRVLIKTSQGELIKRWNLNYFISKDRLYLQELQQDTGEGSRALPSHRFEYFKPGLLPEDRFSTSVDHWGYYNGAENKELVPSLIWHSPVSKNCMYLKGANRKPNPKSMLYGMLKKVTYPTGGSTEYEFEAHDYASKGVLTGNKNGANYDIYLESESKSEVLNAETGSSDSKIIKISGKEASIVEIAIHLDIEDFDPILVGNTEALFTLRGVSDLGEGVRIDYIDAGTQNLVLEPGTYTMKVRAPINDRSHVSARITWIERNKILDVEQQAKIAGGLRIRQVTTGDGMGKKHTTRYLYRLFSEGKGHRSSGVVIAEPRYHYSPPKNEQHFFLARASNSRMPLGSTGGSYVGYKEVTILHDVDPDTPDLTIGRLGKTVSNFRTAEDISDKRIIFDKKFNIENIWPFTPRVRYDWMRGQLTKLSVYNALGNKVQEKEYFFKFYKREHLSTRTFRALSVVPVNAAIGLEVLSKYEIVSGWGVLSRDVSRIYSAESGSGGMEVSSTHEYDELYQQKTKSTQINSDGNSKTSEIRYAHEIYPEMGEGGLHMLSQPYVMTLKNAEGKVLNRSWTTWSNKSGHWRPEANWVWKANGLDDNSIADHPSNVNPETLRVNQFLQYDPYGHILTQKGINGVLSAFRYDSKYNAFLEESRKIYKNRGTKALITKYHYDAKFGVLKSMVDPNGSRTSYQYDQWGRLIEERNHFGEILAQYEYHESYGDLIHLPNRVISRQYFGDNKHIQTTKISDGLGRTLQTHLTDHQTVNLISSVEMDHLGRAIKAYKPYVAYPHGVLDQDIEKNVHRQYGDADRPYAETRYYQEPMSRVKENIAPSLKKEEQPTVKTIYFAEGNQTHVTTIDETGRSTIVSSDGWGRSLSSSQGGATVTHHYDTQDRLKQVTHPDQSVTSYAFNRAGELLEKEQASEGKVRYHYDSLSRLRFSQDANQAAETTERVAFNRYDMLGRVEVSGEAKLERLSFKKLRGDEKYNFEGDHN